MPALSAILSPSSLVREREREREREGGREKVRKREGERERVRKKERERVTGALACFSYLVY